MVEAKGRSPRAQEVAHREFLMGLHSRYKGAMEDPKFHTPLFQTEFWYDLLSADPSIIVSACDWTEEAIRRPMVDMQGHEVPAMLVYLPRDYTGTEGLVRLGQRDPLVNHHVLRLIAEHSGLGSGRYLKVEATLDAPNLGASDVKRLEHLQNQRSVKEQRLSTYILLRRALFVLTGQLPDRNTVSFLGGSRVGWGPILAHCYPTGPGRLVLEWYKSLGHGKPKRGIRFEEEMRAV